MPLLADPQAQPFQPLVTLAYPFGAVEGSAVTAALRLLFALVFTCLLLRRRGLGLGPALSGALAFGLGGFLTLWLGWPLTNAAALLPAWLYALELSAGRGLGRDRCLLMATTTAYLLAGHPETIVYGVLLLAGRFVGLLREQRKERLSWYPGALAALALGAALAAPVLLPTHRYLPETQRAAAISLVGATTSAQSEDIGSLASHLGMAWLPSVAPNTFGNSRYTDYWGRTNSNEDSSGFSGTATLLLALLGFVWVPRRLPGETLARVTVGLVLVLVALPEGVLAQALASVPILGSVAVHGGKRTLLLLNFSLAILAAGTLERLRREPIPKIWLVAVGGCVAALVLGAYFWFPNPSNPSSLLVLRWGWVLWQLRVLTLALVLLAFWPRRRWMPFALAALIAAELTLAHRDANPPMPKELLKAPPPLETLQRVAGEKRMFALGETLPPNLSWLYGLGDLRIYNPMAPASYVRLLSPVALPSGSDHLRIGEADHPILDLLGASFVLTAPGGEVAPPLEMISDDAAGRVYLRPKALTRLFLPGSGKVQVGELREQHLGTGKDFGLQSWVESGPMGSKVEEGWVWVATETRRPDLSSEIETPSWRRARVDLREDRLLASSLFQHEEPAVQSGGWRVLVDERRWPSTRANGPLLAAWLPQGSHRLDLMYRPPGFLLGCLLAALGVSMACILWWPLPTEGRGRKKRGLPTGVIADP